MSPYHRHCFCFSFAGCPCKNFIFSHGHLYFSEEHPYFTTDITIFQSIFYKLVIIYFLFVYVWNTLPHIVHKAAIFVRIYPVPCKHFSGQRLSPAEMRFPFTHPDVYLTGIHPCCPTIFPGWGCILHIWTSPTQANAAAGIIPGCGTEIFTSLSAGLPG